MGYIIDFLINWALTLTDLDSRKVLYESGRV